MYLSGEHKEFLDNLDDARHGERSKYTSKLNNYILMCARECMNCGYDVDGSYFTVIFDKFFKEYRDEMNNLKKENKELKEEENKELKEEVN